MSNQTEQVQSVNIVRLGSEGLTAQSFGLGQLSALEALEGGSKELGNTKFV